MMSLMLWNFAAPLFILRDSTRRSLDGVIILDLLVDRACPERLFSEEPSNGAESNPGGDGEELLSLRLSFSP
jgi:hypothetical protein